MHIIVAGFGNYDAEIASTIFSITSNTNISQAEEATPTLMTIMLASIPLFDWD